MVNLTPAGNLVDKVVKNYRQLMEENTFNMLALTTNEKQQFQPYQLIAFFCILSSNPDLTQIQ